MSFGILQTFFYRLRALDIIHDMKELSPILRQYQAHDEEFETIELELQEEERPPMITIDEYREKFHKDAEPKKEKEK